MRSVLIIGILTPVLAACAPDTVASWSFDEDSPGRVLDAGPAALHGSATGVRYVDGPGGVGRALSFRDGGHVVLPPAVYLKDDATGFSVSFWLRCPRAVRERTIIAAADAPGAPALLMVALDSEGRLTLTSPRASDGKLVGRRRLDDGLWHYVAAAYYPQERSILLFVDDQIEARGDWNTALAGAPMTVSLGAAPSGEFPYSGDLDDLEISAGLPEDFERIIRIRDRFVVLEPGQAGRALAEYRAAAVFGANGVHLGAEFPALPNFTEITGPEDAAVLVQKMAYAVAQIVAGNHGVVPGHVYRSSGGFDLEQYRAEPLVITTEPGIPVPAVLLRLAPAADMEPSPGPAVILLDDVGKADAAGYHWRLITGLADAGMVVCLADPRGIGELAGTWDIPGRKAWAAGAYDIASLARFLGTRSDVVPGRVICVAFGATALPALAAAAIEPSIARAVIVPGAPELTVTCSCACEGQYADLPALLAGLAPRPVWVAGNVTEEDLASVFGLYEAFGNGAAFLATADAPFPDDLVKWLRAGWN